MDKKINDGGPAFPQGEVWHPNREELFTTGGGMSTRDWFAGKALLGQLGNEIAMESVWHIADNNPDKAAELVARQSYRFADAMLKVREESK